MNSWSFGDEIGKGEPNASGIGGNSDDAGYFGAEMGEEAGARESGIEGSDAVGSSTPSSTAGVSEGLVS